MDFAEAVAALRALEGEQVTAQVHGVDAAAAPVMSADGVLGLMPPLDQELEAEVERSASEVATTFVVGGSQTALSLWPSRFLDAVADTPASVTITTRDGVLTVHRNRRWID